MANVLNHVLLDVVLHEDFSIVHYLLQRVRASDVDQEGIEHRVMNRSTMNRIEDYWRGVLVDTFLMMLIIVMQLEALPVVIVMDVLDSMVKVQLLLVVGAVLDCWT